MSGVRLSWTVPKYKENGDGLEFNEIVSYVGKIGNN